MKESFRTRIRKALGLAPDAPEDQILEAIRKLLQEREPVSLVSLLGSAAPLLGLTPEATDDEARERIAALAGRAAEAAEGRVERMVNDAVAAGRLRPSQREWAVSLGASNPESLRMFLVNSGPMVPVGGVMTECGAAGREPSLTESERGVLRLLNISEEDFRRYGG